LLCRITLFFKFQQYFGEHESNHENSERAGEIQYNIRKVSHKVQERPVIHIEIVPVDECIHSQYYCEVDEEHTKTAYRAFESRHPSRHPVDDERVDDDDGMQEHKCPSHEMIRGMDGNRQRK